MIANNVFSTANFVYVLIYDEGFDFSAVSNRNIQVTTKEKMDMRNVTCVECDQFVTAMF